MRSNFLKTYYLSFSLSSRNYYALLGLQEGAPIQDIKDAYRKLVLKHHPDKSTSKMDDEKFKLITEAYQILRTCYKNGECPSYTKFDERESKNVGFGSKIPYWNELSPEKVFKEEWDRCAKIMGMTYQDICKYEQELWKYSEKLTRYTSSMLFPSINLLYQNIPSFLASCSNNYFLNKDQQIGSKLRSNLVKSTKPFKVVKRIYNKRFREASLSEKEITT